MYSHNDYLQRINGLALDIIQLDAECYDKQITLQDTDSDGQTYAEAIAEAAIALANALVEK
jgi:hypothetical protein